MALYDEKYPIRGGGGGSSGVGYGVAGHGVTGGGGGGSGDGYGAAGSAINAPQKGLRDEADQALVLANQLHAALDDLENALVPAQLRDVTRTEAMDDPKSDRREPLAHTIRAVRQRLDSATDRLGALIGRL